VRLLLLILLAASIRVEGPAAEKEHLERRIPRLLAEVEGALGFIFDGEIRVRLASTDEEFRRLGLDPPPWSAAVAIPADFSLVVRLSAMGPPAVTDISSAIRHELTHLLLPVRLRGARVPLWFEEGLAQIVGGRVFRTDLDLVPAAAARGGLIPFPDIARSFPTEGGRAALAYAQSESFAAFIMKGPGVVPLLDAVAAHGSLHAGLAKGFGEDLDSLETAWRATLARGGWWLGPLAGALIPLLLFACSVLVFLAFLRARRRKRRTYEALPE
jgi:hypothetical protein